VPDGLDLLRAATLPMAAETAWRCLDDLEVTAGETLLVHGAGGAIGEAAVSLAVRRGVQVIATAGTNRARGTHAARCCLVRFAVGQVDFRCRDALSMWRHPVGRISPIADSGSDGDDKSGAVLPMHVYDCRAGLDRVARIARPESCAAQARNSIAWAAT
jgi:NAD(P)-dependent dehydrogenase (short-subunit alcohol dehydrogenase family)